MIFKIQTEIRIFKIRKSLEYKQQPKKNCHQNEFAECIKRSSSTYLPNSNWDRKRYLNSNEESRPVRKLFRTAGIENISRPYTIPSRMINSSQVLNKSTR